MKGTPLTKGITDGGDPQSICSLKEQTVDVKSPFPKILENHCEMNCAILTLLDQLSDPV